MPTAYETYLAAKSGRSETAYQRYLRTKAGSGSANGLVDTPAQSTPEPTKRLGMGDFRQIERGGYTGEPMGVGDLRMIERNEAGARIPNEDASFLSPASVFKGAVSKLATLGERVNRGFFRPVAEKHARIQDVVEPGAERAVSRGMEYGARMSGDFAVEGIPGFANRFVNPEEYRSTAGAQAKEAGAGLLGGGKKFFAQAGEELHQTARDFGVTGEENPMRQIYHDLGADKTFEEAVAEYNQDPSGWLQTATIAKGLGKTGAGLARGVRRGFKPVEKAPVVVDPNRVNADVPQKGNEVLNANQPLSEAGLRRVEEMQRLPRRTNEGVAEIKSNDAGAEIQGQVPVIRRSVPKKGKVAKGAVRDLSLGEKRNAPPGSSLSTEGSVAVPRTSHEVARAQKGMGGDKVSPAPVSPAKQPAVKEPLGMAGDEYVYHNSAPRHLESIRDEGLSLKYAGEYPHGDKYREMGIPDEKLRIYFGESPSKIKDFGGSALLRVKKEAIKDNAMSVDMGLRGKETWYFGDRVAPENIEIKTANGWESLVRGTTKKSKPAVSPAKQPTVKEPWEMTREEFIQDQTAHPNEMMTVYRAAPKFPTDNYAKGTFFATDEHTARYYSESHYKGDPADITVKAITVPKSLLDRAPSAKSFTLKEDYPVSPRGAKLSTKGKVALGAGAVATGAAAYQALNEDDREDVASAALGLGVLGTGLMRSPLKEGGGRKLTAKEMRAAKELNTPKLTGKETPGKINIDRMNLSAPEKKYAQVQVDRLKPHLEKMKGAKLTDQEVIDAAGDVKMTQEAIARSETLKRSAQILNARKNEAELLRRENISPKELRSILETVRQVESVKTDLGREMQKLSINVDPELQSTRSALLTRLAKSDVDLSALEKKAAEYQAQGKSLDNPRHVAEFYREFIKPKAAEILDEYRYINMLSSPNTHIVNTTSNLIQGLIVRPGTRLYAGGIDAVGSKLTGAERSYYVRQVPAYYKGMLNSLSDAVKNVRDVMSGESLTLRPDLQNIPTNSKWTKWGYPVTRALEASDIFVRTLIEGAEKEALSYKAKRLGKELDLEDITAEAQHTASQTVFRGELDPSNATGQGWIKSKVFDAPASMLNRLRQLSPPFKWLVPFVQTPLNIAKQGFEYSPLGFAEFGVKDKTAQIAKASLGSTVFVGAGYIAMTNGSTWALPNGKKAREEFYAAGMKPYSLKIGDTWVSYSKLGPLAYPIALAAAMKYHFKDSPNALSDSNSDKVTAGLAEMAQFFSDQSYVQSLGNIIDAMQGATTGEWKGEVSQLIGGTGRQLIPLSALQGWVNGIIDPIYRKSEKDLSPEAILQNMQKNVIGLSTNLEPYKDRKGEISKRPFPVGNALFPFQVSPVDSTGAKTYQKNAEQLQKKRAFDQINDAIKEGRDTDAQAIIDNMKAQGIPVGTLDQFKSEYARKKTKLPKVATPKTPKIQSSVEPLPEIYSSTDIERIPKDLKVEVEVTRAKTGEKHTVKMNGREAVTELHKSLALYNQLLAYLNEGKAA